MKGSNFFWYILSLLSGILISGLLFLLLSQKATTPISILPVPTTSPILVYLSGDVENPGVYELPPKSRLQDLFDLADEDLGGLSTLNLASILYDGQHIDVKFTEFEEKKIIVEIPSADKININEADVEQLMELPGIGNTKANEIILYRETNGYFDKIEDILNVPGIGDATFEVIRDLIVTNSLN